MRVPKQISIEDVEHLGDGEYVVHWLWIESGFPTASLVSTEFEPRDPSVGYFESYYYGSGDDVPKEVEEAAAEAESLRQVDLYDDAQESRYDRENDR